MRAYIRHLNRLITQLEVLKDTSQFNTMKRQWLVHSMAECAYAFFEEKQIVFFSRQSVHKSPLSVSVERKFNSFGLLLVIYAMEHSTNMIDINDEMDFLMLKAKNNLVVVSVRLFEIRSRMEVGLSKKPMQFQIIFGSWRSEAITSFHPSRN